MAFAVRGEGGGRIPWVDTDPPTDSAELFFVGGILPKASTSPSVVGAIISMN